MVELDLLYHVLHNLRAAMVAVMNAGLFVLLECGKNDFRF